MSLFYKINDTSEIPMETHWLPAATFKGKGKLVDENGKAPSADYNGRQYKLIAKQERLYTLGERLSRWLLGAWRVLSSCGKDLKSKQVWKLFTKKTESKRFGEFYETDPAKRKIIDTFTPQMVKALGGVDKVLAIPHLNDWSGDIYANQLTAPIMQSQHSDGSPILLFSYLVKHEIEWKENGISHVEDGYKIQGEYLGRMEQGLMGQGWKNTSESQSHLSLRYLEMIKAGTPEEKYLLNRIERLMQGKPLGRLEQYRDPNDNHAIIVKPKNLETIRPNNAYLQGVDLDHYMNLNTNFYERQYPEGKTDLFLWDPSKSNTDNLTVMKAKFPSMDRIKIFR